VIHRLNQKREKSIRLRKKPTDEVKPDSKIIINRNERSIESVEKKVRGKRFIEKEIESQVSESIETIDVNALKPKSRNPCFGH